jgi:hypothetical protein
MPNNYDFSKLENIKTMEIRPQGWVNPLTIEYGVDFALSSDYFWRVKGTDHTFVIPVSRMDYISSGDYEKHFQEVLEKFAEEYRGWKERGFKIEGFDVPWMREYEDQYRNFIL